MVIGYQKLKLGNAGENLPLVSQYKYLGITIDKRLSIKTHKEIIKRVINTYTDRFFKIRTTALTTSIKLQIWDVFIRSCIVYGLESFLNNKSYVKQISSLYRNSLKKIPGLLSRTNTGTLHLMTATITRELPSCCSCLSVC
jgi:hypothetical protein